MHMPAPLFYTAEMVRNLPDDGNRYETVYGELLVSLSPRPQPDRAGTAVRGVERVPGSHPGPLVLGAPADLSFGRDDVLVQPDIYVVSADDTPLVRWEQVSRLLLAVEILSPSTAR